MKVVRPSEVPQEPATGPIFRGVVTRQSLVTPADSKIYTLANINFEAGARNVFHRHSNDQVLLVTYGTGIVATDAGEVEVRESDVILIPAGEKHWHGATPTSAFSHISLTAVGSTTEVLD